MMDKFFEATVQVTPPNHRDDIIRMARDQGLPETETEGVFRVNTDDLGRFAGDPEQYKAVPLYSAPPQRKPLTEDEISSLFRASGSPVEFARAIERAHGIGGSNE